MNATDPQNAAGGPPSDFEHAPATVTLPGSADAATGQPDPATAELEARLARLAARPIPPTPEAPPEVQAAEKVQANYARAVKITEAGLPLEACRAAVQLAKRPAAPGTREAQWLDRLQQAREIVADREHGRLLLLLGSVGTGKSSLAYVLGVEALAEHRTVRYLTWQDLALEFEAAKAASEDPRTEARFRTRHALTQHLIRLDLLILDELGYLPFSQAGGALLFHLLSKLYERTSVLITTNLGFAAGNNLAVAGTTGTGKTAAPSTGVNSMCVGTVLTTTSASGSIPVLVRPFMLQG